MDSSESAQKLLYDFQTEHEGNMTPGVDYIDVRREAILDAITFAIDNGWSF